MNISCKTEARMPVNYSYMQVNECKLSDSPVFHSLSRYPGSYSNYATCWTPEQAEFGIVLFSTASRPTLGPTKPPLQFLPGIFPRSKSVHGVALTTRLQLVPRLIIRGAIPPLP
jgi:hypothetical protein